MVWYGSNSGFKGHGEMIRTYVEGLRVQGLLILDVQRLGERFCSTEGKVKFT